MHLLVGPGVVRLVPGPIPWTALDAWARRYALDDPDEFDRFAALIRAIETVKPESS